MIIVIISFSLNVFAQGYVPFKYVPSLGWNTSAYKSFRFTSATPGVGSMNLRIKYPNGYDSASISNEKYPLILFLHGKGEAGTDNDYHLLHGGQQHLAAVNDGRFNGFLLYPQHEYQYWTDGTDGNSSYMSPPIQKVLDMVDFLITRYKVDPNRIMVHGLSMGGAASWYIANKRPDLFAAILPMSNGGLPGQIPNLVNTNIWLFQGERDVNPEPQAARLQRDRILAAGGRIRYTEYANVGHGTWNIAYAEPDFFSWMSDQSQLKIHVFGDDPNFCVGGSLRLGVVKNLFQYEWSNGATTNEIVVTSTGSYSVRFKRKSTSAWSDWSTAVNVGNKAVTNPVTITPNRSTALPVSGSNVTLSAPAGFTYLWSNNSTAQSIQVSSPGTFSVRVTESGKCISLPSQSIVVTRGAATSAMTTPSNVVATVLSPTAINLVWNDNSSNETFFEVYFSQTPGGTAVYLGKVDANVNSFSATNLVPNRDHYFRIRAINNTGFSAFSANTLARTLPDILPPTDPTNLQANNKTLNSISLIWNASTDNVGVVAYDIFRDGLLIGSSTTNTYLSTGLSPDIPYLFKVRARDISGNNSGFSNENQQSISFINGLDYKYYEGTWSLIPDFASILEVRGGIGTNFIISPRDLNNRFGFKFEGYVDIQTAGVYNFFTTSDDGSDLFINGVRVVNNDGLHGAVERTGSITLPIGKHAIIVRFFENEGGESLDVKWQGPGISKANIPNARLFRINNNFDGLAPSVPLNLSVAVKKFNSIHLKWNASTDNVGVTGYSIYKNGLLFGTSTTNNFEVTGLDTNNTYTFQVDARDLFGNVSAKSTILTEGLVISRGTSYKYFEGSWNVVPDFLFGNEKKRGVTQNFSISERDRDDDFGFRFESILKIDIGGTYAFYTTSDDGSNLYIDGIKVVDNDGLHGPQERSGSITLSPGDHYLTVDFFELGGGELITAQWEGPGIAKQDIPSNLLSKFFYGVDILPPSKASNFQGVPTRDQVSLSWTSATDNQKVIGYDVYRNGIFVQSLSGNSLILNGLTNSTLYNFGIITKDFAGLRSDTLKLLVSTLTNQAPVFPTISNQVLVEGSSLSLAINATDAENDLIIMSTSNLPSFVSAVDNGNGSLDLVLNPGFTDAGTYTNLSVTATDQFGAFYNQLFNVTVGNSNTSPIFDPIDDISISEAATLTVSISANDETAITLSAAGLPAFSTFTDNGDGTGSIQLTPGYNNAGTYSSIIITADDGTFSSTESFDIIVSNTNRIPVLSAIGNQIVTAPNSLSVPVSATDADGDILTISTVGLPAFATLIDNGNGTGSLNFSPVQTDAGLYSFDVLVTDASFGIASETINITVVGTNFQPEIVELADTSMNENGLITLTVVATDANLNNALTFSANNLPAFATFNDNGDRTATLTFASGYADAGLYASIEISVSDGVLSDQEIFDLEVTNVNREPVVNLISNQSMLANSLLSLNVSATDPDGDLIDLTASFLPAFALFTDNGDGTGVINFSPSVLNVGNYSGLTITAADAESVPVGVSFNLEVLPTNTAPVIGSIANQTLDENTSLNVSISATDVDLDNITLTASNLPSFANFVDNGNGSGAISINPGSSSFGSYNNVTITANDGNGGISSTSFAIYVNDVNILYRVNSGGLQLNASPINWGLDNFSNRSIYLDPASQNATAGSSSWTGVNNTGAPNNLFGQYRTFFAGRVPVMYNFPATNSGEYIINLFFHSKAVNGVNAAGVRRFDVRIEGVTVLSNYDIFADAGNAAVRKSFRVNVTDGNIDIDLARVLADPIICGIEIVGVTSASGGLRSDDLVSNSGVFFNSSNGLDVSVSPNPFHDNLTIRFNEQIKDRIEIVVLDVLGKIIVQENKILMDGTNEVQLDLSNIDFNAGIYFLNLTSSDGRVQRTKLIKE